ncbi:MAG: FAD-dependent oxidoreductase [Flavobacteriales bacterium]|nr:FAD-dependent oxidoreductase [Flavobacteriales bacterium]
METNVGDFGYDILVLALGSTTNFFGNRQMARGGHAAQEHQPGTRYPQRFPAGIRARWCCRRNRVEALPVNFVIVGAGPTGVELAGALAEIRRTVLRNEYREMHSELMRIVLIDSNDRVLKNFSEKSSSNAGKYLEGAGCGTIAEQARGERR